MPAVKTFRVFLSYTGEDLKAHADVVAAAARSCEWLTDDHRDWAATGRPSVGACREHVARCDALIVLVAHRYGWVPSVEEGGDGERSITWLEVEHARSLGLHVLPFIAEGSFAWPPNLMEGLSDPEAQRRLKRFKADLQQGVVGFFTDPRSLDGAVTRALKQLEEALGPRRWSRGPRGEEAPEEETIIPWNPDPSNPPSVADRLRMKLPKRVLSIDSGMVHTALTLGFLERVERILQARYAAPDFRLSDYFDLIGGTGASSVIAASLALGHDVATARRIFVGVMSRAFVNSFLLRRLKWLFRSEPIEEKLREMLGGVALGGEELKTGLCVVATRLDTSQPYAFINDPRAPDFAEVRGIPLKDLIVAGMAVPIYYKPKTLPLGAKGDAGFVSGEITVGSDPSLHLFLLATAAGFSLKWRTGRNRLYLLSLGAGERFLEEPQPPTNMNALSWMALMPSMFIKGAGYNSKALLQSLAWGSTPPGSEDRPAGAAGELAGANPALTYRRYNASLDHDAVAALGFPDLAERTKGATSGDPSLLEEFVAFGHSAAAQQVREEHFTGSFDVRKPYGLKEAAKELPPRAPQDAP